MKKLIVSVFLLGFSVSCASGPATGTEGFEIRRTGLAASEEFWGKYFFQQDYLDPYINANNASQMASPTTFDLEGSFHNQTYSHREMTVPLYPKESSADLLKRWVLNYNNSPYGDGR
jgi:hypothetical protein